MIFIFHVGFDIMNGSIMLCGGWDFRMLGWDGMRCPNMRWKGIRLRGQGWGHNLASSLSCILLLWALSFWMRTLRLVYWTWSKMVAFKICLGGCWTTKSGVCNLARRMLR